MAETNQLLNTGEPREPSAQATGLQLRFQEQSADGSPTGRSATFAGFEFQPLRYGDLIGVKSGDKLTITLRYTGAQVLESTFSELAPGDVASSTLSLESDYSAATFGLIKGGWLPPTLALRADMVFLLDRCTISRLAGRFRNGVKVPDYDSDFLDFFQGQRVRMNPALYALEGNQRTRPSAQSINELWAEASHKIHDALPLAELPPATSLEGVIGLAEDLHESMMREQEFLLRIITDLQAPTSAKRRATVWNRVLDVAGDCSVPKHSLAVLAALSSICVANGASPAKRLLKPSPSYTAQDAYNALSDLRSLKILMSLLALFPRERIMLCTDDRNLALFWTGIRASEFIWSGEHVGYTLSPVDALLPNVTADLLETYLG